MQNPKIGQKNENLKWIFFSKISSNDTRCAKCAKCARPWEKSSEKIFWYFLKNSGSFAGIVTWLWKGHRQTTEQNPIIKTKKSIAKGVDDAPCAVHLWRALPAMQPSPGWIWSGPKKAHKWVIRISFCFEFLAFFCCNSDIFLQTVPPGTQARGRTTQKGVAAPVLAFCRLTHSWLAVRCTFWNPPPHCVAWEALPPCCPCHPKPFAALCSLLRGPHFGSYPPCLLARATEVLERTVLAGFWFVGFG